MEEEDNKIPQPYRDFVTYFLDDESGCLDYMQENPSVYNTISLSLLPEDIQNPEEVVMENKYIFRNTDYKKDDPSHPLLNLNYIYKDAIGDRFFENAFSKCNQTHKFNSINIQGEEGLDTLNKPSNCLEIIPLEEEELSSRFVCPDPDRQKRKLYNRFDLDYNQRCPRYLGNLQNKIDNHSNFCSHFPQIVSENFITLDRCPKESVLGREGPFREKSKRQLLWDPSKKKLSCQVYDEHVGWNYPIYSTK